MLNCLRRRIITKVRYKSSSEILIIVIICRLGLSTRTSSSTRRPPAHASVASLTIQIIPTILFVIEWPLIVLVTSWRRGTVTSTIEIGFIIASPDSSHWGLFLAAHSVFEKLQITSSYLKLLSRVVARIATHWSRIIGTTIPVCPKLLLCCTLLVLSILIWGRLQVIWSSLCWIWKTSTISSWTMGWGRHVIILNWMGDSASIVLTSRAVHVRVVIVLLGSSSRHHLIMLIHRVLVLLRVTTIPHLWVRRIASLVLISESHRSWCRHASRSILLLAMVRHSSTRIPRLLREPATACGHQHATIRLAWIETARSIPVLWL